VRPPFEPLCLSKHLMCSAKLLIKKFVYQKNYENYCYQMLYFKTLPDPLAGFKESYFKRNGKKKEKGKRREKKRVKGGKKEREGERERSKGAVAYLGFG